MLTTKPRPKQKKSKSPKQILNDIVCEIVIVRGLCKDQATEALLERYRQNPEPFLDESCLRRYFQILVHDCLSQTRNPWKDPTQRDYLMQQQIVALDKYAARYKQQVLDQVWYICTFGGEKCLKDCTHEDSRKSKEAYFKLSINNKAHGDFWADIESGFKGDNFGKVAYDCFTTKQVRAIRKKYGLAIS